MAQGSVTCSTPSATPSLIRNEGTAEQVGDFSFVCSNLGQVPATATVTATISGALPITSLVLNPSNSQTEAALLTISSGGGITPQLGTVSGSTVTFSNVSIGSGSSGFVITNIRIDATTLDTSSTSVPPITESVSVSGARVTTASFGPLAVASAYKGLTSSIAQVVNFGVGAIIAGAPTAFTIAYGEAVPNAFKIRGNGNLDTNIGGWQANNTESGYYVQLPPGTSQVANTAASGTRIRIIFNNIPAGIGVYVPATLNSDQVNTSNDGLPYGKAAATSSESGAFSAPPVATNPADYTGTAPLIQLAVTSGTAEAIYEITQDSLQVTESYSVPVFLAGTVPSGAGTMTATISFAPLVTNGTIPNFRQLVSSTTTYNASQFNLVITTSVLATGEQGLPYSQSMQATGGTPAYSWSVNQAAAAQLSSLGLALNASTGQITGTPTGAGSLSFTITVTDSTGASASQLISANILPPVTITTTSLPNGEVGHTYSASLTATGGSGSYTWSVTGGMLPDGLNLNSSTGAITGTALTAGTYGFTVTVVDSIGGSAYLGLSAGSAVVIVPALTISTRLLTTAVQGQPYSQQLAASGGTGSWPACPWTILSSTLPASFSLSCQGLLTSQTIPVSANTQGTFSFTAQVTDSAGDTSSKAFSLVINQSGTVITGNLPAGTAIINIAAAKNGASNSVPDGSVIYLPFNSDGFPIQYTIQPGTYTFRVVDPSDASAIFPQLATNQLSGIFTAWTYHTPTYYVTDYLVFDNTALTDPDSGQLFSGAPLALDTYQGAQTAYSAAVSLGTYNQVHLQSRTAPATNTVTFGATQTLVFVVSDFYIADNDGGISLLIAPVSSPLSITTTSLPNGQAGLPYSSTALSASGGSGHYAWTATGLPTGLTLSTAGVLSGTPLVTGTFSNVSIQVTDPVSGSNTSQTFSIYLSPASPPLTITSLSLPVGTVGGSYSGAFQATGGLGSYTWSINVGGDVGGTFPPGVTFSSSTGLLSGTPTTAGLFNFTVTVHDSAGDAASQPLSILINPTEISITTTNLPAATEGVPYTQAIHATGGSGSYAWSSNFGTLTQAGFSLDPNTGVIAGTPNTSGILRMDVTVTDSQRNRVSQYFELTINAPSAATYDFAVVNAADAILRVSADGATSGYFCDGVSCHPNDITADAQGNVYAHDQQGIARIAPNGSVNQLLTQTGGTGGIALDGQGHVVFVDNSADAIYRMNADGTQLAQVAPFPIASPTELQHTYVTVDSAGNYIVVSDDNSAVKIYRFTPVGSVTTLATIPSRQAGGVTIDNSGNIVFTDPLNRALIAVNNQGSPSVIAQGSPLYGPTGITTEPGSGAFVITDYAEGSELLRVTHAGAVTTILSGTPLGASVSVAVIPQQGSGPLTISPTSLPAGTTGQNYGPVTMWTSGGSGNCAWSATGLPSGLTISSSGIISGVPATSGAFDITISAQDLQTQQTGTLSARLSIYQAVNPPPVPPSVSIYSGTSSIDVGVGTAISATFTASGGQAPYQFSATGLPAGVTLTQSGSLSGAPSQAGNFSVTIQVTDAQYTSASTFLTIHVLGLNVSTLPSGTAGQYFSASVSASGGIPPYSFTGAGLPTGLSLNTSGTLAGTVQSFGTFTFAVTVTDSGGASNTRSLSVTFNKPQALSISSANLPAGTVNTPYSQSLIALGGYPPYTWSISAGSAPGGLTLRSSGILAGVPNVAGSFSFGVIVADNAGATALSTATIVIHAAPLTITSGAQLPSGMRSVAYPNQLLTATGGVAPYKWVLSSGSLPAGITLSSDGVVKGVPTETGTFWLGVTVTDASGCSGNVALALTVRTPSADLQLSTAALRFDLATPATSLPSPQSVGVLPTDPSQQLSYAFSVSPAVPWLTVSGGSLTPSALKVSLIPAALALDSGDHKATITVQCSSPACAGRPPLAVAVDLNVNAGPPKLEILNSLVSFSTIAGSSKALQGSMTIQNTGGGSIGFASVRCQAPWCAVGPLPPSLGGGVSAQIKIIVDPSALGAGYYRTQIDITSSGGKASLPVGLLIAPLSTMYLAPFGMQFNMPAGSSPGNANGSFFVTVTDPTTDTWQAKVMPGADWLTLKSVGGSSTIGQPGSVSFFINDQAASLSPGAYYGRIEITSSTLIDSPEDFEVVLNVVPDKDPLRPEPEPAGLLIITQAGETTPPQDVTVFTGSATPLTFQTSATTDDGAKWLSVAPAIASAAAKSPSTTRVSVDASGLKPGIYTGGVHYSLSAAAVSSVNVTLIVVGASAAAAASRSTAEGVKPMAASCTPAVLAATQTGLVNNFSVPAAWPTPMSILLSDNCGVPVAGGQLVATFSNGDPPLIFSSVNPARGLYSGTWTPRKSAAQMTVVVRASATGFPDTTAQLQGATTPSAAPILTPDSTLHVFDPLIGNGLAPGTIVQIYGQNLATLALPATDLPLPTVVNGTQVLIGGISAPLYYVSPGQINAQLPFELDSTRPYQVIVSANGALTTPNTVQLSPAQPGMAAFPDGILIAQHGDGSLVSASSPAKPGEYLVMYLAGMGRTNDMPKTGEASPSSPLARPELQPTLTINGNPYPILFAGLTPSLVGLYQVNFQVPGGLPAGNLTVVISQNAASSNETLLPYQP